MAKLTVDNGIVTKYSGNVTELTIPDGITEIANPKSFIDKGIFEDHSELINIILPEGLIRIGDKAFANCSGIINITIPQSVKHIGKEAFKGCKNLASITLPKNMDSIGDGAFADCSELKSFTIPDGIVTIQKKSFENCGKLTNIIIPQSVISIKEDAFKGCCELTEITLPEGVKEIGSSSFEGCSKLASINLPEKIKEIPWGAFEGCCELLNITFPNGITRIGTYSFRGCSKLQKITIPNGVQNIDLGAFEYCSGLNSIDIPDSVKEVGDFAFEGCIGAEINESPFYFLGTSLIAYTGKDPHVTIPDGTTEIRRGVFRNRVDIVSVTIPESVIEIGNVAFEGCCNLTQINIPSNMTKIPWGAFKDCANLMEITIPNGVMSIEESAFEGCSELTIISIPEGVKSIGKNAFSRCTKLREIAIPYGVTNLDLSIISGCSSLYKMYIPSSVTVLSAGGWQGIPKNLKQIIIDPETRIEAIKYPKLFVENEYDISPCPMIPINLIEDPETKVKFFFEYCKDPSKSPANIAEGYEKYGKSQRSRILKAAESNNKAEVIAYFEKKGHKVSERTLSPEEKAALLSDTIDNGSNDDLIIILAKYKNFINGSEMLEKTVKQGNFEKTRSLINSGIDFPAGTSCFFDLLESKTISPETKRDICSFCVSNRTQNTPVHEIVFLACVYGYDEIISTWRSNKNENEFLRLDFGYPNWRYYGAFGSLSESECLNTLRLLYEFSDPGEKTILPLENMKGPGFFHLKPIKFVLEHFYVDSYGSLIYGTVCNQDIATLQFLSDYLHDKLSVLYDERNYLYFLGRAVKKIIDTKSKEMLEMVCSAGWTSNFPNSYNGELLLEAIKSGDPELLNILISNGLGSELPSSFSKLEAMRTSVRADNPGALALLSEQGWIRTTANCDALIELAAKEKKTNALAWLLEYKNKTAKPEKEEKARNRKEQKELENSEVKLETLSSINEKSWKTSKNADGTYKIERYLGTEHNLTIPAIIGKRKITTIGKGSFAPDSYSTLRKENIFWDEKKTTVVVSDGITTIEDDAFYEFSDLIAIEISKSVTTIGNNAFNGCWELDSVILSGNVKEITSGVFSGCKKLQNIIIPESVAEIGIDAFAGCRKLQKIIIPNNVRKIGNRAFYGCTSLTDVTIPKSVTDFGLFIFGACSMEKLVLHVYKDSAAMQYAANYGYGLKYEVIDN